MWTNACRVAVAGLLIALASCGGKAEVDEPAGTGGAGGSGAGGSGGAAGAGGSMPDACAVPSSEPPPFNTVFRFTNSTASTVYLHEQCRLQFDVTACADGYAEPLVLSGECTTDCADPNAGCINCGACFDGARAVAPGESAEYTWGGSWYTFESRPTCPCHVAHPALAGKYRVSIPVWDAAFDPYTSMPPPTRTVVRDFDLATSGTVDVPVGP